MRFGSRDWIDALVAALNAQPELSRALAGLGRDAALVIEAGPARAGRAAVAAWVEQEGGRIARWRLLADEDEVLELEPAYVVRAPYRLVRAILRGEVDPVQAALSGRVKVAGDLEALVRRRASPARGRRGAGRGRDRISVGKGRRTHGTRSKGLAGTLFETGDAARRRARPGPCSRTRAARRRWRGRSASRSGATAGSRRLQERFMQAAGIPGRQELPGPREASSRASSARPASSPRGSSARRPSANRAPSGGPPESPATTPASSVAARSAASAESRANVALSLTLSRPGGILRRLFRRPQGG